MVIFLRIWIRLEGYTPPVNLTMGCFMHDYISAIRMGENPLVQSRNLFCALGI